MAWVFLERNKFAIKCNVDDDHNDIMRVIMISPHIFNGQKILGLHIGKINDYFIH